MSHLRKTKKRVNGGAQVVFVCRAGRLADSKCIPDFARASHFRFTNVPPDGDCFFHTLELYYRKKHNAGANKNYRELRATIVNHIILNWDEYSDYAIEQADILELTEAGAWNNNAGDLVVPAAARALGLRINLYDLKDAAPATATHPAEPKQVIKHIYPDPLPLPPPADTVNILRIDDGHFGLLEPIPAAAAPPAGAPRRKPVVAPGSRVTAKKPNVVANASKAMANMKLANKVTTGPATRSKARAAASKKNNGTKRRASLGSRRSSLGSRRSSLKSNSNSSFEREMKRAIEASKRVEVAARGAENAAKKAEMVAKKEAAKAKIAAKKAEAAAKKAAKKAVNNEQMREAENIQRAIAESLKPTTMPGSFF